MEHSLAWSGHRRATSGVRNAGLLRTLLALLLHRLYELPDDIPGLPLHPDGLGLVRVVHLQEVLHAPDVGQGAPQELNGTLLLLLLSALLLLTALRHYVSLQEPPCALRAPSITGVNTACAPVTVCIHEPCSGVYIGK
jgi:hypothetical protein